MAHHRYEELPTCELCPGFESESSEGTCSDEEFANLKPEWLPRWLYTSTWGVPCEVKQMMKQKIERPNKSLGDYGSHLTMFDVSGPAVRLLWIATVIQWPFMIMFPFIAFQFTDCNGLGLPAYHMWLWSLVFPIFAAMMIIEWRCFTYTITPVVQWLERMETPPCCSGFCWWMASQICLSAISTGDVVTQALLLSSTCRWFTCPGWSNVATAWVDIWNNSLFSWVTAGKNLQTILIVTWGLAIMQLPLFVLAALPVRWFVGQNLDFGLCSEKDGYHVSSCWPSLDTATDSEAECCGRVHCKCSKIWHADALKTLATLNRMSYVNAGLFLLQHQRAQIAFKSGDRDRCCQILTMEVRQMIPRIFLINFCQNCIKLEVQTTIFSLGRMVSSTTDNNINWQCLFCILLAQLTATYDLYTILSRAKKLWAGVSMCILPPENRDVSRNGESSTRVAVGEPSQVLETAVREIRWLTWFVWFAGALCATVQLHSMAKLIGAFVCPDAMWNFPDRCADVQKY